MQRQPPQQYRTKPLCQRERQAFPCGNERTTSRVRRIALGKSRVAVQQILIGERFGHGSPVAFVLIRARAGMALAEIEDPESHETRHESFTANGKASGTAAP